MSQRFDIHQEITDKIVASIESGGLGEWQRPWSKGVLTIPNNALTRQTYNGINIFALWVQAEIRGYASCQWGTFKQWKELGASVRKGEKATYIVFCKPLEVAGDDDNEASDRVEMRLMSRAYPVFNADQVDGYEAEKPEAIPLDARLDNVREFVRNTGARIIEGGNSAHYSVESDHIRMPFLNAFTAQGNATAEENYYATLLHELTHWTGATHRLARDHFASREREHYAFEELVAELGSAFLCAELGIALEPRTDHAQYLSHWLQALKDDKRAIFRAANLASKAAQFLKNSQPSVEAAAA